MSHSISNDLVGCPEMDIKVYVPSIIFSDARFFKRLQVFMIVSLSLIARYALISSKSVSKRTHYDNGRISFRSDFNLSTWFFEEPGWILRHIFMSDFKMQMRPRRASCTADFCNFLTLQDNLPHFNMQS